ncbi:baseplate J/gp47 family protein [Bacillus sp. FSL W8-0223]|uniref:baseplate assembly protein n=1 Tax=Bacillus sp. FSL W8-0223 TaxID=2954595 RepID=UPI0030F8DDC5
MTRFGLPDINFVDVDATEFENAAVAKFEELQGVTLEETDPRRKFMQAFAFVATILANNIDYSAKQSRLAYAEDNFLDHLGEDKNVPRLEPTPAKTTIRFQVNNPEKFTIPQGTRMSVGDLFFESTAATVVDVGVPYVDVPFQCTETGTIGNGYLPGQITELVDPLPWVSSAANITTSDGGTDWESNDAYAERIRTSPESYSTAGPELAYIFYAMSANQEIVDAQVLSPGPCQIQIVVLMQNGELPSEEVKQQVLDKCSDRSVRPLTDLVTVVDPVQREYSLTVTYYLPESVMSEQDTYTEAVNKAVEDYILWQKSKLGRGIDPSELYARMREAGAKRVSVEPNEYIELAKNEVAKENTINVQFGGFISD